MNTTFSYVPQMIWISLCCTLAAVVTDARDSHVDSCHGVFHDHVKDCLEVFKAELAVAIDVDDLHDGAGHCAGVDDVCHLLH